MPQMRIDGANAIKRFVANSTFIQVYFEAIANALDVGANDISILINRSDQLEMTITDNGDGFTDEHFGRFCKLLKPRDNYHKGLGRLVYLCNFSTIDVVSVFGENKRTFTYSNDFEDENEVVKAGPADRHGTTLRFHGFRPERIGSNDDLRPSILKRQILAHFLPLFHERKKAAKDFRIEIRLTAHRQKEVVPDQQVITLSDVPLLECKKFRDNTLHAFDDISMYYLIRPKSPEQSTLIAACIDGRTIELNKLLSPTALPKEHSAIFLFESPMFVGKSDNARQKLCLPDHITESMLYRALRPEISTVLRDSLPEIEQKNKDTKKGFEDRYPHLIGLFDDDTTGLIDQDEAIEQAQRSFLKQQKDVLECETLDEATFEKSLEVSSRALTEYILYRNFTIKKLAALKKADLEDSHHSLIVPQYTRYDGSKVMDDVYGNNAWLLDDRFMSFRVILSEERMDRIIKEITKSDSVKNDDAPDICMIFTGDPEVETSVDVVVVEIKRKDESDKNNFYVIAQLAERAGMLAQACKNINRMWYYGILTITPQFAAILSTSGYKNLYSKGQVWCTEMSPLRPDGSKISAPVTLLDYDALISDATARNHAFLEFLKKAFKQKESADAEVSSEAEPSPTTSNEPRHQRSPVSRRARGDAGGPTAPR